MRHLPKKTMKNCNLYSRPIRSFLIASCIGLASASLLQAENSYWAEFGAKPVFVEQNNYGNVQTLKFVDYKNEMLMAEVEMNNPDGTKSVAEISQPVSDAMVKTLSFQLKDFKKAVRLVDNGNFTGALEFMRPEVYPLVKFHLVPESFNQLHNPVRKLIDTLVDAGEYAEAEDLVNRIALEKVSPKYSNSAIRLMNAYLQAEDFDGSARIANSLPVEGQYSRNIRSVLDTADALRGAGNYDAVIPLYRAIQEAVPVNVKRNVDMWLAYSLVLADQLDEATEILESLDEPDPKDELFSLYKLLEGSREYRKENYSEALDTLTRGFVRAQTSYSWVPEMLFLIGDCYQRAGDNLAARNVWTEVSILYPDVPWASRANESLTKLPPQAETKATQ